ncbi:uncharacterized protein LOC106087597 [Stomoxys calcitrans]|uniref:Uncharacterized protein n=1 Tax=Stomoxys calcitrans TaxID=35570 RepID=A0A1I8PAE7_STOCA|nr:uncharacterized protein LOC106087597 [Stomoxys calcitrans]
MNIANCITCLLWVLSTCCLVVSNAYRNIRLEDNLCANRLLVKIKNQFYGSSMTLLEDRDSAAIITQRWNTSLPGLHSSSKIRYDCEFKVQSSEEPFRLPRGIYTVITRLKFRRDPETEECLDWIQFKGGNRSPSQRICNEVSIDGPAGRLIFDERDRDVTVLIHIEKNRMITEPLELRMVLTAHSECKYTGDFLCDPQNLYSCISRYFVRDNVTNCMYPCRDEVSCFHDVVPAPEVDTTSVALSAITSLIFTMLGVGFCIWICWKYWNCITVQQRAHEDSARTGRRQHRPQHEQRGASRDAPVIELPTAPTFNIHATTANHNNSVTRPAHQEDAAKDLPPSYEELFPDR